MDTFIIIKGECDVLQLLATHQGRMSKSPATADKVKYSVCCMTVYSLPYKPLLET